MLVARRFHVVRGKMLAFLDNLEETSGTGVSRYMPAGLSPQQVAQLVENADPTKSATELAQLAASSKTGAVIFWSQSQKYLVMPPFPITEERFEPGFSTEPLRALLAHDYHVAVVLVRLGSYAIGVCQGENLVASKVGTGNVHSRHRQGGSSAKRFQRHREKQIESFLTRACGHIREVFERSPAPIDYIAYGGASTTIRLLRKQCPMLGQFDDRNLSPLLDIGEPRQPVLEAAVSRIFSSVVIEWHEEARPVPATHDFMSSRLSSDS